MKVKMLIAATFFFTCYNSFSQQLNILDSSNKIIKSYKNHSTINKKDLINAIITLTVGDTIIVKSTVFLGGNDFKQPYVYPELRGSKIDLFFIAEHLKETILEHHTFLVFDELIGNIKNGINKKMNPLSFQIIE